METERGLVKTTEARLPKFVQDAYETIEGMEKFAALLLSSKLVPDHFYEKGPDKKPDYTKGKVSAVVVVLLQAQQLQIPPMTALQHIIPVNGLLSIKGDLAKTMIFASGKLRKDSWVETVTGSIENEDMVVSITATREDNGLTLTRTFSVDKAKRMGLWVTPAMIRGQDGWKYEKSAWYKTPERMLGYRCLGFIARDLFSDVLLNMYTTEEAIDMPRDVTEIIETESGAKITIPDKEHAAKRAEKLTARVAGKIKTEGFAPVTTTIPDAVVVNEDGNGSKPENAETPQEEQSPFIPQRGSVETFDGKVTKVDGVPVNEETPAEIPLEAMETKDLLKIVNADLDMMEAMQMIPGKNTNKKLRGIIEAYRDGSLAEHVTGFLSAEVGQTDDAPKDKAEMSVNKDFDRQGEVVTKNAGLFDEEPKPKASGGNKYGIEIPELDADGKRDFSTVKKLFNLLTTMTNPPITSQRYTELAEKKGVLAAFPDKETFLKNATTKFINELLDTN